MKILFRTATLLIALFGSAQITFSCSCIELGHEKEIEKTEFIFVGTVVGITEDKTYVAPKVEAASATAQKMLDARRRYLIEFKIEEKFKGVGSDEITLVRYEQPNPMCGGISFEKEKSYLVYAGRNENKNRDEEISDRGICSRTQNFSKDSKDYQELLNFGIRNESK